MISGIFHRGSGLGDQLHRYITVRTLALDKGYKWGMIGKENFKGINFMDIEIDAFTQINQDKKYITPDGITMTYWNEKDVRINDIDIRSYDPEINFVPDNTIIDGYFEDEKYWGHRINEIRNWLKVKPIEMANNLCVIGFRGGEYSADPHLFLSLDYWRDAITIMQMRHPSIEFEVHTDDQLLAKKFFPKFPIVAAIERNWRSVRYAKHLIVANSAFYIMPMLLGDAEDIIAPRGWARRNIGIWARPACYYKDKRITYI